MPLLEVIIEGKLEKDGRLYHIATILRPHYNADCAKIQMKIVDIILLGNRVRNAFTDCVPILNMGYWMSQHEPSKEGFRNESK